VSFPFAVLSTAKGKNISLCVLCVLSEAGGGYTLTYAGFRLLKKGVAL